MHLYTKLDIWKSRVEPPNKLQRKAQLMKKRKLNSLFPLSTVSLKRFQTVKFKMKV